MHTTQHHLTLCTQVQPNSRPTAIKPHKIAKIDYTMRTAHNIQFDSVSKCVPAVGKHNTSAP